MSKKKSTPMSWSTALFQRLFDRVIKHHTLTFSTSLVAASTIAGALLMWAVVPPTAQIGRPTLHVSETTQRVRLQSMLDSVKNRDKTKSTIDFEGFKTLLQFHEENGTSAVHRRQNSEVVLEEFVQKCLCWVIGKI